MNEKMKKLQNFIEDAHSIVFIGGAGVSTESGIPDFRSKDGLYSLKYPVSPETILSASFFQNHPDTFYDFYRDKMNATIFEPNFIHTFLAQLEKKGKLKAIITQNIDGLHTKAGSQNVLELHGSIYRNFCTQCHTFYPSDKIFCKKRAIPLCSCGAIIKPDVVLYGEPLDNHIWNEAERQIKQADLCIVGGTSLTVYPANSLLHYFKGKHLVIINKEATSYDNKADLVIYDSLSNVFQNISI